MHATIVLRNGKVVGVFANEADALTSIEHTHPDARITWEDDPEGGRACRASVSYRGEITAMYTTAIAPVNGKSVLNLDMHAEYIDQTDWSNA